MDDPVVIAFHFLQSMAGRMPLQVSQLMHRAALHLDPGPVLLHRSSQPFVPVDDHQARPFQPTIDQPLDKPAPALTRLALQKLQVQHHLLPVRFDPQSHQHRR